jgi:putative transposase
VVWRILLIAAARMTSIFAACRDLAGAPSDDAIGKALARWLPARTKTLEEWFEPVLAGQWLPRSLFRKSRLVAFDYHHIPYHGEPSRHANELWRGKPKSGTTKSHVYATLCVVFKGFRYTLAVTSVKNHEPAVAVLARLLDRLAARGLSVKTLLLDRQFCTSPIMAELQSRAIPFLMPLVFRGRKAKRRAKAGAKHRATLRDFQRQGAGRYRFAWLTGQQSVTFDIVVACKTYSHRRTGRRRVKKLYFAAWRVRGEPRAIRELYRKRFAIEASYRQLGQARIRTSTREPVERLLYVLIALVLRNPWVWLHWLYFAEHHGGELVLHLERLRFRRMLTWIAHVITQLLHDGTPYQT